MTLLIKTLFQAENNKEILNLFKEKIKKSL
jgi:hypothetical protein